MPFVLRCALAVLWCVGATAPARAGEAPLLRMQTPDITAALAADALKAGPQPFRFAVPVVTAITPGSHGEWTQTTDGRARWQLTVESPGATSLNFGFTRIALPQGAAITFTATDGSARLGPFGPEALAAGQLWTPVMRSSSVRLELSVPSALRDAVSFELTRVNHGFRGFGAQDETTAKSGSCNIDVVCAEGDDWRREIRSVARYTISGALLCSGQLVNNSAQDFTPYFLTANHCLTTAAQAPTTVFYWNYQTSRCGGTPDGSLDQTQAGALYLAGSGGATEVGPDFTLLQLLSTPPADFKVYYSGWDRRNIAPVGVTGIHHPSGDEKRISFDFDQTFVSAYAQMPESPMSALMPTHLMVARWDRGVTEGGSSGSGIWNRDRRLVGQLSGGSSSCTAPQDPDWYGRLFTSFSATNTALTSLGPWLDPEGKNEVLDGIDPAGSTIITPPPGSTAPPISSNPGSGSSGGSTSSGGSGSAGGGALGYSVGVLMLLALSRRWVKPQR